MDKETGIGLLLINTLIILTVGICYLLPEYEQNRIDHPEVKPLLIIAFVLISGMWYYIGKSNN